MTWVLVGWGALVLYWVVAAHNGANCGELTTERARNACEDGAGLGVSILLLIGLVGFAFLGVIWYLTRLGGLRARFRRAVERRPGSDPGEH
jgi:hypothetical protein